MNSKNTCVILAGGLGTRLKSAVPDRPKCLAKIGRRPFLEVQLEMLARQGITQFVLSLGHMAEMVIGEVERLSARYSIVTVTEKQPLGTGGAMLLAMQESGLEEALVTNGDTFLGGSLQGMLLPLQLTRGEWIRMGITEVPERSRFGGVVVTDKKVSGFLEKGMSGSGYINAGFYRIHRKCFDGFMPGDVFSFETDVLVERAQQGHVGANVTVGEFTDIGVPEDYHRFCMSHG